VHQVARRLGFLATRIGAWLGLRLLPSARWAVVHGWPDWEGNAVQVLHGLVRRYPGRIHWLLDSLDPAQALAGEGLSPDRVLALPKTSLRALYALLRAEVVFYTHGLATAVEPPPSRLIVNLWHGDGPKATEDVSRHKASVVVGSTTLWTRYKATIFGLPPERAAVVGNPRVERMLEPVPPQAMEALGLCRSKRLVLWLPTYRQGRDGSGRDRVEGSLLTETVDGAIVVPDGVRLVVKPHPMDTDDYSDLGATVVTDARLSAAGTNLYQLMGSADALVSDASSAWVDFLLLDRPLGFFLPDVDAYGQTRGYNVPRLAEVLPGPVLSTAAELSDFLESVATGEAIVPTAHPSFPAIGFCPNREVTDALLDWLDRFQAGRGRRPLFSRVEAQGGPRTRA
jgi:CDP-glycerol glycerophosphotransferase